MHEYSLVEALVRRVEDEARKRHATRIHGLRVTIGELAGVDPELFRTAYETFRAGTLCAETPLTVVHHPAAWACSGCQRPIARGEPLRCTACGAPAKLDAKSDGLLLESIDMEVP
jgi:hydrogenase nickel incorporation protein HypA/HybF